jgi:hypothetical protein
MAAAAAPTTTSITVPVITAAELAEMPAPAAAAPPDELPAAAEAAAGSAASASEEQESRAINTITMLFIAGLPGKLANSFLSFWRYYRSSNPEIGNYRRVAGPGIALLWRPGGQGAKNGLRLCSQYLSCMECHEGEACGSHDESNQCADATSQS